MNTIKLTMSQALTKWMTNQKIEQFSSKHENAFVGVWGIFGHGNVAGLGEALFDVKDKLPTFRGHNEQGMAHAAISFAKQKIRSLAVLTAKPFIGLSKHIVCCQRDSGATRCILVRTRWLNDMCNDNP